MIGQNLPGAEKSFWPFNKSSKASDATNNKPLTPFYVELRSDLYGHERQFPQTGNEGGDGGFMRLFFGSKPVPPTIPMNTGIPAQQNIVLQHVNKEYESYRYSVQAATKSKAHAATELGQVSFQRALEKVLLRLTDRQDRQRLTIIEEHFLDKGGELVDKLASLRAMLVDTNTSTLFGQCNNTEATAAKTTTLLFLQAPPRHEPRCLNVENSSSTELPLGKDDSNRNETIRNSTNTTLTMIQTTEKMLSASVMAFLKRITESLPPGPANGIRDALTGHLGTFGTVALVSDLRRRPMRTLFSSTTTRKKRLFVTHFLGDILASAVSVLRKEVTAIVRSAEPGDEVLVVLQSAGGTVTGYGLVAAQLLRIKEASLPLTVAVEQVAASGGYMAACVGNVIVCSPFAVVGSIGAVQNMPNVFERLKREGIAFHQITAGEFKRVLSPTKEVTPEDLKKAQEDVEEVWTLFKDFVSEQRPALNLDIVATGEVWFGKKALDLGLCDAIQAADDVLTDFVDRGYDVYRVKYEEPITEFFDKILEELGKVAAAKDGPGLLLRLVQKIAPQLQGELGFGNKYQENWDIFWNRVLFA